MIDVNHLNMLQKGVEIWNHWRLDNLYANLAKANLAGVNLVNANLFNANLSEADLRDADLRDSVLSGAKLYKTNLKGADLSDVNLYNANLREANLQDTKFIKSDLQNAILNYADLSNSDLSKANLENADLSSIKLRKGNLFKANLTKVNLTDADIEGAILTDANLAQSICIRTNFINADLRFARLANANLDGANLTGVHLWETQRSGWSIKRVICKYAYLEDNDKRTYFNEGEFEKLYSDKIKVVLFYQDGISPLEIATLPALIKHLESTYPGCRLRLESISDAAQGIAVRLVIDNDEDYNGEEIKRVKAILDAKAKEVVEYQRIALTERENRLMLEGEVKQLNAFVDKLIMKPSQHYGDFIQGDKTMGDNYTLGQGIAGKNVHAHDINFNQIGSQIEESIDLSKLAAQLKELREAMSQEAEEPEHFIAIGEVAKAEKAAEEKNSSKVAESLKAAGKWALDFGTKIGVSLATDAIKKSMGMS